MRVVIPDRPIHLAQHRDTDELLALAPQAGLIDKAAKIQQLEAVWPWVRDSIG